MGGQAGAIPYEVSKYIGLQRISCGVLALPLASMEAVTGKLDLYKEDVDQLSDHRLFWLTKLICAYLSDPEVIMRRCPRLRVLEIHCAKDAFSFPPLERMERLVLTSRGRNCNPNKRFMTNLITNLPNLLVLKLDFITSKVYFPQQTTFRRLRELVVTCSGFTLDKGFVAPRLQTLHVRGAVHYDGGIWSDTPFYKFSPRELVGLTTLSGFFDPALLSECAKLLVNLQHLTLTYVNAVPDAVGDFVGLTTLQLKQPMHHRHQSCLPLSRSVMRLTRLVELEDYNNCMGLPTWLGKMPALRIVRCKMGAQPAVRGVGVRRLGRVRFEVPNISCSDTDDYEECDEQDRILGGYDSVSDVESEW